MSAAKLLLKIRRNVLSPHESAILIILISFGLFHTVASDIAPNLDDDPTGGGGDMKTFDTIDTYNSINNKLENLHPGNENSAGAGAGGDSTKSSIPNGSNLGFIHAFIASISVILVSELGDKTFFIAAIMAMRHPRLTVFTGAIAALALMTILSAVFGMAATIIPRVYTYYISTALFAIFGLKMLKEGYYMSPTDAQEELEEVQSDLRKREDELLKSVRQEYRKNDDDDDHHPNNNNNNNNENDVRCGDPDGNTGRRLSGWKTTKTINNGSDDDDDHEYGDSATKAMISKSLNISNNNNGGGSIQKKKISGNVIIHESTRRTQSAVNLKSMSSTSALPNGGNLLNSPTTTSSGRYSLDLDEGIDVISPSLTNSTTIAALANGGDLTIQNSGMELRRLERESVTTSIIQDPESGVMRKVAKRGAYYLATRIFMQAFTMTFLAEWGDRSQLTTIILGAREDVYGVIVGGVLGHSICTGLAVIGGRMIAQKISVRTVTLVGGVVFLVFAVSALFFDPNDE